MAVYVDYPKTFTAAQLAEKMPSALGLLSDEPEMESSLHAAQLVLLVTILEWLWQERSDYFMGHNLTIYFSREQLKSRDFRGPDFFLVKDVVKWPRPSWVVWEEGGKYPNLIIELLSDSTADVDRGLKKALYQDRFRTPEYFWFSPDTLEFAGFRLVGHAYQDIETTPEGWRWSQELELFLGIHEGQLRYFSTTGALIPTPREAANQQKRRADQEHIRAERLAQRLRELGVDPDRI
jgi:Uma2 family endonuclease